MALTEKQRRFVGEYLIDLNATQAAIRAGYSEKTARSVGNENLTKPDVQEAIRQAMKAREERTEITKDMVLKRWWQIATADPNELVQYRRLCCRHCWGKGHKYQWTEGELAAAQAKAVQDGKPAPVASGGTGYRTNREPNPVCPECGGEGRGKIHVHDTRKLKGAAKLLYAGVKVGKEGLEVKTHDQGKALENVARHLGMFTDRVEHTGPNGGPIKTESTVRQDLSKLTDEQLAQLKQLAMAARVGGD